MRIAVLGTGKMGLSTASGLRRIGHDAVLGSRHPDHHDDLPVPVFETAAAVRDSEIVVTAIDGKSSLAAFSALADAIGERIVLDVGNAVDENFDPVHPHGSLGERLQQALPGARVVKSLSTVWGEVAINPGRLATPGTVFLSGNDAAAKHTVAALLTELGWPATSQLDLGGIDTAKAVEHYFVLFTQLRVNFGDAGFNIAVVR